MARDVHVRKNNMNIKKLRLGLGLLYCLCFLLGCATTKGANTNPQDPYENINRKSFAFNRMVDKAVIRPVSYAYHTVMPNFVLRAVNNFFSNLQDIPTTANEILQFKLYNAWSDVWRLGINSTIGIFGLFDVASNMGLTKHYEDFGLTLAHWGVKESIYLVVPFLGPSTLRDFAGFPVNIGMTVYPYIHPLAASYELYGGSIVSDRAQLLDADQFVEQALDPYIFVRDAYLQKRQAEISGDASVGESIYLGSNEKSTVLV